MKKWLILLGMGLFLRGSGWCSDPTQAAPLVKRYAVVIGANKGGRGRVELRYAVSDARAFWGILEELGGVSREDGLLLLDPDTATVSAEMEKLRSRMGRSRSEHGRIEVVFYYSGHSDETHLLLDEGRISYEELRGMIDRLPADVRIAVLDSCSSGAFTRPKGGKKRPAFLMDEAYQMQGHAFLTSSSSTEASQESDLLKSSFFTHYLTSGLRGAADLNEDGRVTLNEAYQFAFDETLAETTQTLTGPQHPNYDIQMSGAGDVVMTDVRSSSAVLVLGPEISGRIFIHDQDYLLVMELTKPAGRRITLGLDEGRYRVIKISEGQVFESGISVKAGKDTELDPAGFVRSAQKYTTPRGDRAFRVRKEFLSRGFVGRPITRNVMIPTGATLNRGEYIVGLGPVSYGISDRVQVGTQVLLLLFRYLNADLKTALIKSEPLALAAGLAWESFSVDVAGIENRYTSLSPYVAVSPRVSEKTTFHFVGRYSFFTSHPDLRLAESSANAAGTSISAGLDFSLSNRMKLQCEAGYDTTFEAYRSGAAVLFGWERFRLSLGVSYRTPRHSPAGAQLMVGLWWRFGGR